MQSRRWSLFEALANVAVGMGIALLSQLVIFSAYGIEVTLRQNAEMVCWFTAISIVRSYALRRVFNRIRK